MALTTPVVADFGETGNKDLDKFVEDNLRALINAYDDLHRGKLAKWRKLTKGKPKDVTKDFPWSNASNVVIQIIGENVDTIKAVMLGTIYEIMPLWTAGLVGDWKPEEKGDEQREAVQAFMDLMGLSKSELDLYRVESKAAHDIASLGSVVIKFPWITQTEQLVTGLDTEGKRIEETVDIYDGPRPEKLEYENWAATPTAQTWESAQFKFHKYLLYKQDCEKKVFEGAFDKDAWEQIKMSPDVTGLTDEENAKMEDGNIQEPTPNKEMERWRFYECWFKYFHGNKTYNIILTMHLDPVLRMKAIFNFYPKNEEPFEFGRLGFNEDGLIGYGFAEMGEYYQEEITTGHNQRVDNRTLLNTSVLIGGNNPRIDAGVSLFPMAVLPFNKDEVEIASLGSKADSSVPEEQLSIALAKARFGTDMPGAEGMGSGTVGKKGYSSMGTFSIMQQGARRININVTDFRYLHLNCGQKFLRQYAYFGVGQDRLKYLGQQAQYLKMAMEAIKTGRLELPIKAATASINKEIEKQTGMLFTQVMQRHYGVIAQTLQGVTNPIVPEPIKKFLLGSIVGQSYIMSRLLRAFGYDDIMRMQPELDAVKMIEDMDKQKQGANNGQRPIQGNAGAPQGGNGEQSVQQVNGVQANNPNASPGAGAEVHRGLLV